MQWICKCSALWIKNDQVSVCVCATPVYCVTDSYGRGGMWCRKWKAPETDEQKSEKKRKAEEAKKRKREKDVKREDWA